MLIGNIYIVARNVRIVDVDGSYQDITIDDALKFYEWLAKHRGRLLEELRSQQEAMRKKEKSEEKTNN